MEKTLKQKNMNNHTLDTFTYTDNNDGTHAKKNACCGTLVANEAHDYTEETPCVSDTFRYKWSDGTTADITVDWEITKGQSTIAFNNDASLDKTYDGNMINEPMADKYTVEGNDSVTFEWYKGDVKLDGAPIDAGEYKVKAIVAENENYLGASAELEFEITKKDIVIQIDKTYDGNTNVIGNVVYPDLNNSVIEDDKLYVEFDYVGDPQTSSSNTGNYPLDKSSVIITGEKAGNYNVSSISVQINKAESNIQFKDSYVASKIYDGDPAIAPTEDDYTFDGDSNVYVRWYDAYTDDFDDQQTEERDTAPINPTLHFYYVEIYTTETQNYKASSAHVLFEVINTTVSFGIYDIEDLVTNTSFVGVVERGTVSQNDAMKLVVDGQIVADVVVQLITVTDGGVTNETSVDTETVGTIRVMVVGNYTSYDCNAHNMMIVKLS